MRSTTLLPGNIRICLENNEKKLLARQPIDDSGVTESKEDSCIRTSVSGGATVCDLVTVRSVASASTICCLLNRESGMSEDIRATLTQRIRS